MSFVTEVISGNSVPGVGSNGAAHTTQVNVDSTGLYNFNPTSLAQAQYASRNQSGLFI